MLFRRSRILLPGKVEFRNDAGGNIHAVVGKLSFDEAKLQDNIQAFIDHIKKMKPSALEGRLY